MRDLLLVHLENERYGVWKDEILSIREVQALHRIPLSPACIAGMSIIDDRTVTLADLPVCIGYASAAQNGEGRILMLASPEKITGFMVTGDIDTISVPPDSVFPVPEYLKTEVIDFCAVRDSAPIPIINVAKLCAHLIKADQEPIAPALTVPMQAADAVTGQAEVRIFELSGEMFAAPSKGMQDRAIKPGRIATLSLLPEYVRGITFRDNKILPVIDLCQRIKRQRCRPDASMVVDEIGGRQFGFLVDDDRGIFSKEDMLISDLPPVARISWLSKAVVRSGETIPLVDPAALLLSRQGQSVEKPQDQRYTPESEFPEFFKRQDVDVVEFLLLGARHALPKSEVEDIIPFKSFRPIPDTPEIVVGIAEHNGTLLPVLDLAMVFGRRSPVKTEWSMIVVRNGDFRALVVTEAVLGEPRLSLDLQKSVPILLPHRVVYGCYPAADGVRLIMNVYAMTVHFEKSLVKDLLPALSAEMKMARAEIVHTLLDEQPVAGVAAELAPSGAFETDSEQEQQPVAGAAEQLSDIGISPVPGTEQAAISAAYQNQEPASEMVATRASEAGSEPEPQPAEAAAEVARSGAVETDSEQKQQPLSGTVEQVSDSGVPVVSITEQAAASLAYQSQEQASPEETENIREKSDLLCAAARAEVTEPSQSSETVEQQAEEQIEIPETAKTASEAPAAPAAAEEASTVTILPAPERPFLASEERPVRTEDEIPVQATEETMPEKAPIEIIHTAPGIDGPALPDEEPEAAASTGNRQVQADEPRFVAETAREQQPEVFPQDRAQTDAEADLREEPEGSGALQPETVRTGFFNQRPDNAHAAETAGPSRLSQPSSDFSLKEKGKGRLRYAVAGAILVALLSSVVFLKKSSIPEKRTGENPLPKTAALTTEESVLPKKNKPSLELDIPASRIVDTQVYLVVKGDTLWSISERFTGNPFNYPRIAGENKIANPDLIFPGQKIRLIKK